MNEYTLTNAELKQVANCELDAVYPGLACDRTSDGLIDCQHCPIGYYCGFISVAGQKKLLKWLNEPCDKHPEIRTYDAFSHTDMRWHLRELRYYPKHRYLCPDCIKELEEQNG
jgi:hypothetical protein